MTDDQLYELLACLGFGFGSLFWLFITWLVFSQKER